MTHYRHISGMVLISLLSVMFAGPDARARQWQKTLDSAAQDYLMIVDNRSGGELVLVLWLAPQAIPPGKGVEEAKKILSQYTIVGVVHVRTSDAGVMSPEDVPEIKLTSAPGEVLSRIAEGSLPPAPAAVVAALQALFRQSLGKVGNGMKWFYFDGASVDSCGKGRLTINAVGENYTYDTPIPGCPAP